MKAPGGSVVREYLSSAVGFFGVAATLVLLARSYDDVAYRWQAGPMFLAALLLGNRLHSYWTQPQDERQGIVRPWSYYLVQAVLLAAIYFPLYFWLAGGVFRDAVELVYALLAICLVVTGIFSFIPALLARPLMRMREDVTPDVTRRPVGGGSASQGWSLAAHYLADVAAFCAVAYGAAAVAWNLNLQFPVWVGVLAFPAAMLLSAIFDEAVVKLVDRPAGRVRRYRYRGGHLLVLGAFFFTINIFLYPRGLYALDPAGYFVRDTLVWTGLAAFLPFLFFGPPTQRAPVQDPQT